jgi:fructan beta-fructosidase
VKTQGIAYSTDRGRSWIKYDRNPVLPNSEFIDFNDPKVFMHEASQRWVMILAAGGIVRFYTSINLKEWEYASAFGTTLISEGEVWESPDLLRMLVEETGEEKWVLIVSSNSGGQAEWKTQYISGEFDGTTFSSPQPTPFYIDFGKDNYAATTLSNMPDHRHILIGWMSNWNYAEQVPYETWHGATTIPRELKLHKVQNYYLLAASPIKETESLYGSNVTIMGVDVKQERGNPEATVELSGKIHFQILPSDVRIRFRTTDRMRMGFAETFGIKLSNKLGEFVKVGYDNYHNGFYSDRQNAVQKPFSTHFSGLHFLPYDIEDASVVNMRIILDVSSMELFAMDGKPVITDSFFPTSQFNILEVFAENGSITVESISVTQLKSIYKNK